MSPGLGKHAPQQNGGALRQAPKSRTVICTSGPSALPPSSKGTPPAEPACSMALVAASPQAVVISWISWSLAPTWASQRRRSARMDDSVSGATGSSTAKLSAIGTL